MSELFSDNIQIRVAGPGDCPAIRSIAHRTWPSTFSEILSEAQIAYMLNMMYEVEALERQLVEMGHQFLIISSDGADAGFISFETNYKGQPVTKIHKIYMLPKTQGKGLGRRLIAAAEQKARDEKNSELTLNVNKHNKAELFYHRIGFRTIGSEDIDIGGGFLMEDKILAKGISPGADA